MYGVGIQIALAFGESTIALLFLTEMSWRQIFYLLLALAVSANFMLVYLIESPMFLLKKNFLLMIESLNQIAKINKRPPISEEDEDTIDLRLMEEKEEEEEEAEGVKETSSNILDLFKYKSLRWISISSGMIFLGIQTIYYSTSLNLGSAGFSKTINQEIIGVSEMSGYIAAEFIIHKCYRKKSSYIGLGFSTAMCGVLAVLISFKTEDNENLFKWLQTAGLLLNRFVLCAIWSIFFVYVGELYPTKVRSLGYGWTSLIGNIGSTISPYILLISELIGLNSWVVPTILGGVAWLFVSCLPETRGKSLKDDIEERSETEGSAKFIVIQEEKEPDGIVN